MSLLPCLLAGLLDQAAGSVYTLTATHRFAVVGSFCNLRNNLDVLLFATRLLLVLVL